MSELSVQTSLDEFEKIAFAFWNLISQNLKNHRINSTDVAKAKYKGWVDPVRLAIERDGRTKEDFTKIYRFLTNESPSDDGFLWSTVILSTVNLRQKFEKVLLAAAKKSRQNKNSSTPPSPAAIEADYDPIIEMQKKALRKQNQLL